jgi:uncharacterized phage protein (TIGR02218 family)
MRTVSPALATYLAAGRQGWIGEMYTIRLSSGTLLRWSASDAAIRWAGNTWSLGPGLERGKVSRKLGLEPGTMQLTILPRATDLVGATPLALALRRGDFDGALVRLDRAYAPTGGAAIVGVIEGWFFGKLGELAGDGFEYQGEVVDPLADLEAPFPANVLQAGCPNRLFDDVCGLNPAAYLVAGTVTGGVNAARTAFTTSLGAAAGYYTFGVFEWTSGANVGRRATVRQADAAGVLKFAVGWPEPVLVGDAFEVLPGCDKKLATCASKFSNVIHFRGAPAVPAPETTT